MHRVLADFSRWANKVLGGEDGKTLCNRFAVRFGPDCFFCRVVGGVLRDPTHCLMEMTGHEIAAWIKRRTK